MTSTHPTRCHADLDDERLVALVRAGDARAFCAIHDRYRGPLLGFAARMLRDAGHDPEDVVQDAFIRAHAALRATDEPIALRAWLYTIVRNRAMDELRRPARARGDLEDVLRLMPMPHADPAHRALEREAFQEVVGEIGRLPRRQRLALVMRELDGRTHQEMAGALDATIPATKALVARARVNLADAVQAA